MAITRLPDVFPAHRHRVIIATLVLQSALLCVLGILLYITGMSLLVMLIYVIFPVAVLQFFAFYVIGKYALEPLDFLARTVTQVSDQPHTTTPPNLNGSYHERTGFKLMVDTIYGLALQGPQTPNIAITGDSLYQAILDRIPGGVIVLDEDRNVIYSNAAAPIITDSAGKKQIQLLFDDSETLDSWLTSVEASQVSAEKVWQRVQTVPLGEVDRRVFDIVAFYQKNGQQGIETIALFFDQTARYAINEDSMDFMALAAHELRGPITVIRGYLDILRAELETSFTADQRLLFDRLDVSSSRLSGYVSNILNASKFDRRHLRLHLREDRLIDVYSIVADDLALRASTQGRIVSVSIPTDLPTIAADRNSLSEVLANLVDNGIKYSREGGLVSVTAAVEGNYVKCTVQDSGIGIPSSVIGNLFSKFYRSHRSKQAITGTGLGLYISKAIIESHGGGISVNSTEGKGSTFSFRVPIYSTVADKLKANDTDNQGIIESTNGWIKNHSMYRG